MDNGQLDEEFDGEPPYSSPYPNLSSYYVPFEYAETQEEHTTESDPSLEKVNPLPLIFRQILRY